MSNTPTLNTSGRPIPTVGSFQTYWAKDIDPVKFCAKHRITTIHPFKIYQYFFNGTFPPDALEALTPTQRRTIYRGSLLGRLVKSESRGRLQEALALDFKKQQERLGASSTAIPKFTIDAIPMTAEEFHREDAYDYPFKYGTFQHIVDMAYFQAKIWLPWENLNPFHFMKDKQLMLQPSSDLHYAVVPQPQLIPKQTASFQIGIVGLPNVGKSSIYNLLTGLSALAFDYPFCTTGDGNSCQFPIVDQRFQHIAQHANQTAYNGLETGNKLSIVPPKLSIVDTPGLVRNATIGQGLGNTFLHTISAAHVIYQVVRCFDDVNTKDDAIEHVETSVDPVRDIEIINQELVEKDLEQLYHRVASMQLPGRIEHFVNPQLAVQKDFELAVLLKAHTWLRETNKPLRLCSWTDQEAKFLSTLQTLSSKPVCYILNMSTYQYCDPAKRDKLVTAVTDLLLSQGFTDAVCVPVSAVYEQARLAYQKRYVPLVGCTFGELKANIPQLLQGSPDRPVPDLSPNPTLEMLCIAALGREIQAARLNFGTSAKHTAPLPPTAHPSQAALSKADDKKHSKKDKKDDKKHKKDDKKDSKKDKKASSTKKDGKAPVLEGIGGDACGFSDFLGDNFPLSPELVPKDSKPEQINNVAPTAHLSPDPTTNLLANASTAFGSDNIPEPLTEHQEQDKSHPFWSSVNQFLQFTPPLLGLLNHLVYCDENDHPVFNPKMVQGGAGKLELNVMGFDSPGSDEGELDSTSVPDMGKPFFIDSTNSNPLTSLILSALTLIHAVQYYTIAKVNSSQIIRGDLVPENSTTVLAAAAHISPDAYNNCQSVALVSYEDFHTSGFSLEKCREMDLVATPNKHFMLCDGNVLNLNTNSNE